MAADSQITELLARIRRLEEDNGRLSARVEELNEPVARRGVLKRAGALAIGASALAAGSALMPPSAAADDGQPILMGRNSTVNTSPTPTEYHVGGDRGRSVGAFRVYNSNSSGDRRTHALEGFANDYGVLGRGDTRAGVIGLYQADFGETRVDQAGVGGVGGGSANGVMGVSDLGTGVVGHSGSNIGVHGSCDNDSGYGVFGDGSQSVTGVGGFSSSGVAVAGHSEEGRGVVGICDQTTGDINVGVHGVLTARSDAPAGTFAGVAGESRDFVGVQGMSTSADGILGRSTNGRGGSFTGGSAALRLVPGSSANPPASGLAGDLFVDSGARLWYCSGGAGWVRLA